MSKIFTFIAVILTVTFCFAQEQKEAEQINTLISQAQKEIKAEEEAIKKQKESSLSLEKEYQEKILTLRKEIVSFKKKAEKTTENKQNLTEKTQKIEEELSNKKSSCAKIEQFLEEVKNDMEKKSELFPSVFFKKMLSPYSENNSTTTIGQIADAFNKAISLLDITDKSILCNEDILTSSGVEKPASVLTIGGIAQLYLTEDKNDCGLLMYSEKGGRKFLHNPSRNIKRIIVNLFNTIETGKEQAMLIPVDVTQEMVGSTKYGFESFSDWFLRGGPVMIPIAIVALLAFFMLLNRLFVLRKEPASADKLFKQTLSVQKTSDWEKAADKLYSTRNALSTVIAAGIENRETSAEKMEENMRSAAIVEVGRLEKFLHSIAVLATISPLLGLLGTVTGMISTFNTITAYGSSDPRLLSSGISEALITTEAGLIIAIPIMLLHSLLSSRVDKIIDEMEKAIVKTVNIFFQQTNSPE
ncbi:MAG: MotA/TolQ/ExbB proton channel family protein [Planctomycetota bacterium]